MSSPVPGRRQRQLVTKTVTVPGNLRRACDEFNAGRHFESHETLEEIWQEEQGEVRDLYKGLIQVAAGFVHLTRNNYVGANRLFSTALGYLQPYRTEGALGFNVEDVCRAVERCHAEVKRLGPGRVAQVDLAEAPRWDFDEAVLPAEAIRWSAWGFDRSGAPLPMTITVVE